MITAINCFRKYGKPGKDNPFMTMWDVPPAIEIGLIPKRIYCNEDLIIPLENAFQNLIERCTEDGINSYVDELKTWDGCFNVRVIRGYEKKYAELIKAGKFEEANRLMSIHSWAVAVDVNAFENGLGKEPKLSAGFVKCFTDTGFDWGGNWKRKDGMHFQLSKI